MSKIYIKGSHADGKTQQVLDMASAQGLEVVTVEVEPAQEEPKELAEQLVDAIGEALGFGPETSARRGSRRALEAAREILKARGVPSK